MNSLVGRIPNSLLRDSIVFGRSIAFLSLAVFVLFLQDWKLTYGYFYWGEFQKANGVITKSYVKYFPKSGKWDTNKFCPVVKYQYWVGGRSYTAARLNFSGGACGSEGKCLSLISQYPVGSSATVFYVPNRPEIAALNPHEKDWTKAGALALPVLLTITIGCLALSIWAGRVLRVRSRREQHSPEG